MGRSRLSKRVSPQSDERNGIAVALVAYIVWGLLTLYWKQLHGYNAFELIGWRITCAAIVMAVVVTTTRRWPTVSKALTDPSILRRVALAAILLTINWTTYVWAVVHDQVIETALGYFMAPLGSMALGVLLLHERLRSAQRAAAVLAACAVVTLTYSYGRVPWFALVIATTWTTYGYLKKKVPLSAIDSMAAETFVLLAPAIAAVAIFSQSASSIVGTASGPRMIYVAFSGLATVVPLTLFAYAAKRVPLSTIGLMQYIIPVMNFMLGWLVFHEPLPTSRVIGFGLVWVALIVVTVDSVRAMSAINRVHGADN